MGERENAVSRDECVLFDCEDDAKERMRGGWWLDFK